MIPIRNAARIFGIAYVLGTLVLIFSLLLAQVPRPRHGADFPLDYICWSVSAALMLISLGSGRRWWGRWYPSGDSGWTAYTVFYATWFELALSFYAIFSFGRRSLSSAKVFAFSSPLCYLHLRRFQQEPVVTPCPSSKTCHPEGIRQGCAKDLSVKRLAGWSWRATVAAAFLGRRFWSRK